MKKARYLFRSYEFGITLLVLIKSNVCISAAVVMQVIRKVSFPLELIDALLTGWFLSILGLLMKSLWSQNCINTKKNTQKDLDFFTLALISHWYQCLFFQSFDGYHWVFKALSVLGTQISLTFNLHCLHCLQTSSTWNKPLTGPWLFFSRVNFSKLVT